MPLTILDWPPTNERGSAAPSEMARNVVPGPMAVSTRSRQPVRTAVEAASRSTQSATGPEIVLVSYAVHVARIPVGERSGVTGERSAFELSGSTPASPPRRTTAIVEDSPASAAAPVPNAISAWRRLRTSRCSMGRPVAIHAGGLTEVRPPAGEAKRSRRSSGRRWRAWRTWRSCARSARRTWGA